MKKSEKKTRKEFEKRGWNLSNAWSEKNIKLIENMALTNIEDLNNLPKSLLSQGELFLFYMAITAWDKLVIGYKHFAKSEKLISIIVGNNTSKEIYSKTIYDKHFEAYIEEVSTLTEACNRLYEIVKDYK